MSVKTRDHTLNRRSLTTPGNSAM